MHHPLSGEMEEFFEDSEIFVTGGSGVVGKALVEKLLRSCNVRRIYVLLRPRKQLTAEQRLVRLRQATVFHVLAVQKPEELDKIVAVPGDVSLPGLGIDPSMMQRMKGVSLVYHCAATVRFDEPLREAVRLNVGGTLEALKFAETLPQLRAFIHVSTFYSNPYLTRVEPKVGVLRILDYLACFPDFVALILAVLLLADGLAVVPPNDRRCRRRRDAQRVNKKVSQRGSLPPY